MLLPGLPVEYFRVEYEALHVVWFECGAVGHKMSECPGKTRDENREDNGREAETNGNKQEKQLETRLNFNKNKDVSEERFGEWMLVNRKTRNPTHQTKGKLTTKNSMKKDANSFSAKFLKRKSAQERWDHALL